MLKRFSFIAVLLGALFALITVLVPAGTMSSANAVPGGTGGTRPPTATPTPTPTETPIPIPTDSPDLADIVPQPTFTPAQPQLLQYLCVEYQPNVWTPVFTEDAADLASIAGKVFRPLPNTAYGCTSYGNVPTYTFEVPAGTSVPNFLNPNTWGSLSEDTWLTYDNPLTESGIDPYRDPVPPSNPEVKYGCDGKYRKMASNWNLDGQYLYFHLVLGSQTKRVRLSASVEYWWCPNKGRPDIVKPIEATYIVTHPDGPAGPFQNAKFYPFFVDSNTYKKPKGYTINRDGDRKQIVGNQEFGESGTPWMQISQNAEWAMRTKLTLADPSLDPEFHFVNFNGTTTKRFNPLGDDQIGPWFNYYG